MRDTVVVNWDPPTGARVTQADIDAFAAITHDRQWILVDVERARLEDR